MDHSSRMVHSGYNLMMAHQILIIEDDVKTADLIRLYLQREGYDVLVCHDGRSGLQQARERHTDLIILDLMLPEIDGLDICHFLRAESDPPGVPIIMLTARSTEDDKLLGLDIGADDYITKPFSPRELTGRVRALLRRAGKYSGQPPIIEAADLRVEQGTRRAYQNGHDLELTPNEFRLLYTLIAQPGRVFSRDELLNRAFGSDYEGLERTVDVHILNLRKKIEADPSHPQVIQTVYGFGYTLNIE